MATDDNSVNYNNAHGNVPPSYSLIKNNNKHTTDSFNSYSVPDE